MMHRYVRRVCAALFCATALMSGAHAAQTLKGPIRIVVGYPPGGAADAVARVYADKLREALQLSVVVENRPGAGGQIAAQTFLSAPKDGTMLLVANSHMMSTLPLTIPSVKYDPVNDFAPIGKMAGFEHVLAVGHGVAAKSLDEYIGMTRKDANAGMFGIPAPGSAPQFIGYTLAQKNNVPLVPVPYKGGGPLVADLLGGHVTAGIDALGGMVEHHRSGRLKILAVTGPRRMDALPEVPTFTELGYPSLDTSGWVGLFAPRGTDSAIIAQVNQALTDISSKPEIQAALLPIGFVPASSTPAGLQEAVAQDLAIWGPIIKASGYQAQ
jgi:tripartite-type tricarboxylate transporter receptor subunit TctC